MPAVHRPHLEQQGLSLYMQLNNSNTGKTWPNNDTSSPWNTEIDIKMILKTGNRKSISDIIVRAKHRAQKITYTLGVQL